MVYIYGKNGEVVESYNDPQEFLDNYYYKTQQSYNKGFIHALWLFTIIMALATIIKITVF